MTREEAIVEAKIRWRDSNLHHAYETLEMLPGATVVVPQCHVIAHNPFRGGRGGTYEEAFADAEKGDK